MADKIWRGALIGFGQVVESAHVPGFSGNVNFRLDAVADSVPSRLITARNLLPKARFYPDAASLFRSESALDFAVIATPPSSHAPLVLQALSRGLHVLCEKPLALGLPDLEKIEASARRRGKTVFTVHNWAYSPLWRKVEELSGSLGKIAHVELHTLRTQPAGQANPGSWRSQARIAGGGIAVDHGWHSLYQIYRLIGCDARRVSSDLRRPAPDAVEQEASVLLEFPEASALLRLTWRAAERSNWGLIEGRKGALEMRDDHILVRRGAGQERFDFPEKISGGSAHPGWFAAMLEDFRAELSTSRRRHANLREARFCAETLRRILGRPVARPRTAGAAS